MLRWLLVLLTWQLLAGGGAPASAARPLWQKLVPRKQVESDPNVDYTLTKDEGPWLILAASFSGPEGEQQARDLVLEFRGRYRLPAYYYGMTFEVGEANPGRGVDSYGSRIKRRYQRGSSVREHAVLVGEFPSLDDAEAQRTLQQIKTMEPESLTAKEGESTSQSLATVRQFHSFLREKIGNPDTKGPMGHAFLSRNPLLPKEYFVPQGVDEDIAKWNEGLEYSLMKCPGRYSIRVATFKGRTSLKAALDESESTRTRKATDDDPLVVAGKNAHLLTVALRDKGWEAYEFHDRRESYVTIGSFHEGQTHPDGRIFLKSRDAKIIVDTFGATSPNNVFNRPAQQFNQVFGSQMGKVAEGFHPKRFVGLPLDIHPQPVQVPRRSVSSAYARK